jgi:hypothetical protein
VTVYFAERPRKDGERFAINLYQPGMAENVNDTAFALP